MLRKAITLGLTLCMLVLSLVGCGGNTESSSPASTPKQSSSEQEATTESNFNATGYPIVKEPITLKVLLCIRDIDTLTEIDSMKVIQDLEAKTGIHAEWEVVKGTDWETKLNLMFASGEYPDVILSANSKVDYEEYGVTQKLLLPLDDYIAQYMPIYSERAAAEPTDVLAGLRASDGKMYSVGTLMAQNINTPGHYFINETWLDALNMNAPKTVEELTQVLRAFKSQDPNGNGKNDEIPYEIMLEDDVYGVKMVMPFFGIPSTLWGNYLYIDNDKKVQFIGYQDGLRDCLDWLNQCYTEGLLDVEVISQDTNMLQTKLTEGNVGFFTAWRLKETSFSDWALENAVITNPVVAEGYNISMYKSMELARNGAYITTSNQYIPETMRWFDAMLETETMFSLFAGERGDGWDYNDKGLIDAAGASNTGDAMDELNVNSLFFAPGEYYYSVYEMAPHRVEKTEYCKAYTEAGFMQKYSNDLLKLAPLTSEEIAKCTLVETDVKNAMKEYMADFIINGVTEDGWKAFQGIFKNMGVDEYISIYQNALDKSEN